MLSDLFSSFNPLVSSPLGELPLNWISIFFLLVYFSTPFWSVGSKFHKSITMMFFILVKEMKSFMPLSFPPGGCLVFVGLFSFILLANLMGLFPYVFTHTSHFSITFSMSMSMGVGLFLTQIFNNINQLFAHMAPLSTPNTLLPLMVLIETISYMIRPLTLGVRLGANMIAGHLLMTLLGSSFPCDLTLSIIILIMISALLLLELGVSIIQSYVFTTLSSLYFSENNYLVKKTPA